MRGLFKKWFVPNQDNNFHPDALQKAAFVGMTLMVLLSFSIANLQSLLWISSTWLVSTVLPAVVTEETNSARLASGYGALERNVLLDRAAELKAEDMASGSYFAHWSPDGLSPWHWFGEAGYDYAYAGENLAVHFTDSSAVVEAWMQSPTHRANIMNGNYTQIGVGTAKAVYEGYDTVFVVQMFGKPALAAPVSPVEESRPAEDNETDTSVVEGVVSTDVAPTTVAGVDSVTSSEVTEEGTMVLESFSATEGSITEPSAGLSDTTPRWWERLATSPRVVLQIIYSLLGLFVLGALLFSMVMEWRRHHSAQVAYSVGLLVMMILLFQLHLNLSSGVIIA